MKNLVLRQIFSLVFSIVLLCTSFFSTLNAQYCDYDETLGEDVWPYDPFLENSLNSFVIPPQISGNIHPSLAIKNATKGWMGKLNPNLRLNEISIPGTHDAGAEAWELTPFVHTQEWNIMEQLEAGIRFFDMRVREDENDTLIWNIYHGAYDLELSFNQVLTWMNDFLDDPDNEKEVIIVTIHSSESLDPSIVPHYGSTRNNYIASNPKILHGGNTLVDIPKLGDVQGRIYLIDNHNDTIRYKMNSHPYYIIAPLIPGDFILGEQTVTMDAKIRTIKEHMDLAAYSSDWVLTGISGVGAPLLQPFDVALVTNYETFHHVNTKPSKTSVGTVVMDFPGEGLIYRIIKTNFNYDRIVDFTVQIDCYFNLDVGGATSNDITVKLYNGWEFIGEKTQEPGCNGVLDAYFRIVGVTKAMPQEYTHIVVSTDNADPNDGFGIDEMYINRTKYSPFDTETLDFFEEDEELEKWGEDAGLLWCLSTAGNNEFGDIASGGCKDCYTFVKQRKDGAWGNDCNNIHGGYPGDILDQMNYYSNNGISPYYQLYQNWQDPNAHLNLPVTLCKPYVEVSLDQNGLAFIDPSIFDFGSFDPNNLSEEDNSPYTPSPVLAFLGQSIFDCSWLGCNTVELLVVSETSSGSFSRCTTTVRVFPSAICQNVTVQLNSVGNGYASASAVNNNSSNVCGSASLSYSLSQTIFDCSEVGTQSVTLTATDMNGNGNTCTATVTVEDNVSPMMRCQNTTVQLGDFGNGSISVSDIDNGTSDACGIQTLSLSQTAFDCAEVGTHSVTLTATDMNGNSNTCTATVTVEDNVSPMMRCQNTTVQLGDFGNGSISVSDIDNGTSDACDIQTLSLSQTTFDCAEVGTQSVTLTATDMNGNSNTCTAAVTVEDNVNPMMRCQNTSVQLDDFGNGLISVSDIDNGTSDACDIQTLSLSQTTFDCADVGTQSVTLIAMDMNGNSNSCTATVTVEDNVSPMMRCQNTSVQLYDFGNGLILVSDIDNGTSDACDIQTLSLSQTTFDCADVGTQSVTLTATDMNGNSNTCTATVTVEDNIPPQIDTPCPEGIVLCGAQVVNWIPPVATDNCAVVASVSNYNTGDYLDVGVHVVSYTFYDAAGLSVSCSFDVTIHPLPVITISTSNLPAFCQGVQSLSVRIMNEGDLTPPISYAWSNGLGTAPEAIAAENNTTYSLTVTDDNGCSAVASYYLSVDLSNLLSAHVIVANDELEMSESEVFGGGVGLFDADEDVSIVNNSTIHTFLESSEVYIDGSSSVANYIDGSSSLGLPVFSSNNFNDLNDITVPAGTTTTLSGNHYGKITVMNNATLIFNNPSVFVKSITTKTGSTIGFNQATNLMLRRSLSIGQNNSINASAEDVVIYVGDDLKVKEGSYVLADIYAQEGIEVNESGSRLTTYMIGLFIANDGVESGDEVIWDWNFGCNAITTPPVSLAQQINTGNVVQASVGKDLAIYPNPTTGSFTIDVLDFMDKTIDIKIYNSLGEVVWQQHVNKLDLALLKLDLSSAQFSNGIYYISVKSADEMKTKSLVLNK